MTDRRTFASDEEREDYELTRLGELDAAKASVTHDHDADYAPVAHTHPPTMQRFSSSSPLTLTTAQQNVPGCTYTLPAGTGSVLVIGVFDFSHSATGGGTAVGELTVAGVTQGGIAPVNQAAVRGSATQAWIVPKGASPKVLNLVASKTVNAGTVTANSTHTTLTVAEFT